MGRARETPLSSQIVFLEKRNAELEQRIEELEDLRDETCKWREESQGEYWSTECGQAHCFTADGPRENNHNFCPYCRGRLTLEDG